MMTMYELPEGSVRAGGRNGGVGSWTPKTTPVAICQKVRLGVTGKR